MQKNVLKKLLASHKWDFVLGATLLIIALCLFLVFRNNKTEGNYVQIEQDGKIIAEYPLDIDKEIEIKCFYGSNVLVIKNEKVYVKNATCTDKICEKMGPISKNGEMIICIPNELFIRIISDKKGDYDAISE